MVVAVGGLSFNCQEDEIRTGDDVRCYNNNWHDVGLKWVVRRTPCLAIVEKSLTLGLAKVIVSYSHVTT